MPPQMAQGQPMGQPQGPMSIGDPEIAQAMAKIRNSQL